MFFKTSIEFPPKVSAAFEVLFELRCGTKYDNIYDRPLQDVPFSRLPQEFAEPVWVDALGNDVVAHPRQHLQEFSVDYCNWVKEEWNDPKKSDPFVFDGYSNWYVMLWHNHHTDRSPGAKSGTLIVGITQLPKQPPRINSYSLRMRNWQDYKGHYAVLLPRLQPKARLRAVS